MFTNIIKKDIRSLSQDDLKDFFSDKGEKHYRAKQVYEWLWKRSAHTFNEMTNLSKATRKLLEDHFIINAVKLDSVQVSSDKTIKSSFKLFDGNLIEGVLIPALTDSPASNLMQAGVSAGKPAKNRMTACISSQVGCTLSCKFCATGKLKKLRNLNHDEIYDQVVLIRNQSEKYYNAPLTNIVYMGMGEPLFNYENVLASVEKITSPDGLNMSPDRITISTVGIAQMIKKLGDDNVKFNLALSLNSANDKKRNEIMPVGKNNSLVSLSKALKYFHSKTGKRLTYEYIIFKDFNDGITDAKELSEFCKIVPCKVNIIEYNPIGEKRFERADTGKVTDLANYLESRNIIVNIRRSRGKDIKAACGQLAIRC
ncbi:MAG: 23S rRNA (adenine(2503)-C(2))-methyltransferase RlmN [Bacteroidota bacterium]